MNPSIPHFLEVVSGQLLAEIAPAVEPPYRQASVAMTGVLLGLVREELDRAAERRVAENRELRRIFAEAAPVVSDAGLRSRLESAAGARETSLRVSDLEQRNAELRGLLVDLHAHVEVLETPEARRIEDQVWRELVASTERRRCSLAPF